MPTAAEIQTRIDAEQKRLATEQQRETELIAKRAGPLEAGDDAALNKIEGAIAESRTTQQRIAERVAILQQRMEAEQAAELNAALDAAEGDAAKAREIGE